MTVPEDGGVIVALDKLELAAVAPIVEAVRDVAWGVKLNDLAYAPGIDAVLEHHRPRLFLDLKVHDIPNTVANTVSRVCARFAPELLTVHASGGVEMMAAAVRAANEATQGATRIVAVTVLTSLDAAACERIYGVAPREAVSRLAAFAAEAGCHGIVCSAEELDVARRVGLPAVVPGIRPAWHAAEQGAGAADDQRRVATPQTAKQAGARYLVIGRPIVTAADPAAAARRTVAEFNGSEM